jgi:hypothetical protein
MFEQDRFIVRLQQKVAREAGIMACFLAGSFGRRTEDAFSDLDVALVFDSKAGRDAAWEQRETFVREILPYVPAKSFDAAHVRPYLHIALYSNGAKVDYRFENRAELMPNPFDRELRILKDPVGWAETYQAQCAQTFLPPQRISSAEIKALDHRFWVMFWDVYRLLLRGDTDKPFTIYLELLHFTLPALLRLLPPEDPAYQGLLAAYFTRDAPATRQQMKTLLVAYLAARSAVIRRTNVHYMPDSGFERSVRGLVERHG